MITRSSESQVVIVGAGIAGLAAAYILNRQGVNTRVLEATSRAGGRMTSDIEGGYIIDRGAQFLSTEYTLILDLLKELGLSHLVSRTSKWSAVVRDGTPRRIRAGSAVDALSSRLLGFPAWIKLGWTTLRFFNRLAKLPLNDYSCWAAFDTESTSSWVNRDMDPQVTDYVYEPMLQGFYFQASEETSKALALALTAFGMRRSKSLSLEGGLGVLPEALSRKVDVTLNRPVLSINRHAGKIHVETPSEAILADRVILAVPAPDALRLIHHLADDIEKRLISTRYAASINVACMTTPAFDLPGSLKDVYGLLIPRKEHCGIAAVGIERNKNRKHASAGHLLNIMYSHESATRLMSRSDEEIVQTAVQCVKAFFPRLSRDACNARVYRWPHAEPRVSVGKAADLKLYRERCAHAVPNIILAGDYMSMPYTEGAAESGAWASHLLLQDPSNRG